MESLFQDMPLLIENFHVKNWITLSRKKILLRFMAIAFGSHLWRNLLMVSILIKKSMSSLFFAASARYNFANGVKKHLYFLVQENKKESYYAFLMLLTWETIINKLDISSSSCFHCSLPKEKRVWKEFKYVMTRQFIFVHWAFITCLSRQLYYHLLIVLSHCFIWIRWMEEDKIVTIILMSSVFQLSCLFFFPS